MTLDFQAGVDKAVRYHLAKNGILGRQGDHGGGDTQRTQKMKTVSRQILSTQSFCQELTLQLQKGPTV